MRAAKVRIFLLLSVLLSGLLSDPAKAITFGEEVMSASSSFPSVVSIWYTTSTSEEPIFYCTGTLIESDIVLTAAHCVEDAGVYFIKYGANLRKDSYLRTVSATWKSPNYSSDQLVGDVGLLKLTDPIAGAQTTPLLSATEIKKVLLDKKKKLEIVGWGKDQNSILPQYLKRLSVDDYSSTMQKKYPREWRSAIWFAVGKYDKRQKIYAGSCYGDSGGPLFAYSKGQQYLVGVTSHGAEDCETFAPSVYMRLTAYASEIRSKGLQFVRLNEITQNRAFPSVLEAPTISGTAAAGSTVTCNQGRWSSNTTSVTVSWTTPSGTYNATSLILSETYAARTIQCTVTGKNSNGEIKRVLTIVQPATPVKPSTPYPSISGVSSYSNTTAGTVAQCSATSYASDVVMSYQWGYGTSSYVSSLSNPLGSGSTLTISQSILDTVKGKYLICQATATNSAGSSSGYTTQSVTGPSATPTPTPTPTASATPTPTASATPTPTASATPTLSAARQELINGNLNSRTGLVDAPRSGMCKPGGTLTTTRLFPASPGDDFYVWWGASTIYYDVNTAVSNADFFAIGWFNNRDPLPATITITDAQWAQLNGKYLVVRTSYNYARFRGFEPYGYSSILCTP